GRDFGKPVLVLSRWPAMSPWRPNQRPTTVLMCEVLPFQPELKMSFCLGLDFNKPDSSVSVRDGPRDFTLNFHAAFRSRYYEVCLNGSTQWNRAPQANAGSTWAHIEQ